MASESFVDYYDLLQLSPSADADTIHKVYRILAQRYHPDNHETGNSDMFRSLTEAFHVLSDPERRAAYDVQHRGARRLAWKIFDQSTAPQGVDAERRKREGILALLYRKRVGQPDQPFLTLREIEDLLGVPKEHLEFALWFLKENQWIQRSDNARFSITFQGVQEAERSIERRAEPVSLLNPASRVA